MAPCGFKQKLICILLTTLLLVYPCFAYSFHPDCTVQPLKSVVKAGDSSLDVIAKRQVEDCKKTSGRDDVLTSLSFIEVVSFEEYNQLSNTIESVSHKNHSYLFLTYRVLRI